MSLFKHFLSFTIYTVMLCTSAITHAHALKETTATITVRSGQIDVLVNTDFSYWLSLLHNNEAWLLGDTELVLQDGQTEQVKRKKLQELVRTHTKIQANGALLSCQLNEFPAKLNQLHKGHHSRAYFRLGCVSPHQQLSAVSLVLPKSLGRVYTSLVQPKQQLIGAGEKAEFKL
ncbi:hypothetical protein [Pseudoalteromonas umbrosa]|uniref:hypothetical protein n=1 Tax=Pseudoalteromonas umbrosa TaxID=3048489 RepID=UPI0024C2E6BD|nr:hypothetical protein [Pseudoalteromonas sp. B95]MDK1289852.1 hypothetical protein [Pseudoalteromonas sp. B95]